MFDALMALLRNAPAPATADTVGAPFPRRELAVAALLLEVAQCDRRVGRAERAAIESIVRERLRFDMPERIAIVGQMWDLVYADGHLENLEEALMQRLAGELGIAAADFEAARAQAFARDGAARGGERE
jgi:uncharacterized tellurite resistance protein B-like protein